MRAYRPPEARIVWRQVTEARRHAEIMTRSLEMRRLFYLRQHQEIKDGSLKSMK